MQDGRFHRILTEALKAIAADELGLRASPYVEAGLRDQVRAVARARRRRSAVAAGLAVAATVVGAAAVPAWRWMHPAPAAPAETAPASDASLATREVVTAFLPLPYSAVPMTNAEVVRLEVPRAALASFGLTPVESFDASSPGTVLADVLVGEDGLARAVRFVRPAAAAGQEQIP